jgi:hypothetical protein
MIEPITPAQARLSHETVIPSVVIEAINRLLSRHYNDKRIIIELSQLKTEIAITGFNIQMQNQWLDFENIYRKQGWRVVRDIPGYNESYETFWEFLPNKIDSRFTRE